MSSKVSYVEDSNGNKFTIKQYNRIISLVPSITDLLFSFGLENSIIGVTKYCTSPENARSLPRKVLGGTKNPQIAEIIELKPDLVLMNQEENQLKHYNILLESNIPVFVTYPRTVLDALAMMKDLKKLFKVESVQELDFLETKISRINEEISKRKIKRKVFCPIWKKPWMSFNQDTFVSNMIEFCGGENVVRDYSERYPVINLAGIKKMDIDLVLLPDEPYSFSQTDKEELLNFFGQSMQIELIDGTFHWYCLKMNSSLDKLLSIINVKS